MVSACPVRCTSRPSFAGSTASVGTSIDRALALLEAARGRDSAALVAPHRGQRRTDAEESGHNALDRACEPLEPGLVPDLPVDVGHAPPCFSSGRTMAPAF